MANSNPYVDRLLEEINPILMSRNPTNLVDYMLREHITPRNQKIHELNVVIARLGASINRLEKALARHNPGVCKDGESPIDCAIRMLSPVRDTTPNRDRP